jgi:hypothetical protein
MLRKKNQTSNARPNGKALNFKERDQLDFFYKLPLSEYSPIFNSGVGRSGYSQSWGSCDVMRLCVIAYDAVLFF